MNELQEQEKQFHFDHITPSLVGGTVLYWEGPQDLCFSSEKNRTWVKIQLP